MSETLSETPSESRPVRTATVGALARLLGPQVAARFRDDHWEQGHLFVSGGGSGRLRHLFDLADLDAMLAVALATAPSQVHVIPPPDSGRKTSMDASALNLGALYQAFQRGETLRIARIQDLWPPLAAFAHQLAGELEARVSVNLYATPAGSQGFPVHLDLHDAFLAQVAGAKQWSVYAPELQLPSRSIDGLESVLRTPVPEDSVTHLETKRLETGDVLYLPRGVYHQGWTEESHSVHLTFGIASTYWVDVLKKAVGLAALDEPALRRRYPSELDQGELHRRFTELIGEVVKALSFHDTAQALERERTEGFPPDGHFTSLVAVDRLDPTSLVERRPGVTARIRQSGARLRLEFAGAGIDMPARLGPVLEHLRRQDEPFAVADLPGLDEGSCLVLVRRLVREGLLRIVSL